MGHRAYEQRYLYDICVCVCLIVSVCQAGEAVRLEFLSGGSSSAIYREKLIQYFSQQLRCCRADILSQSNCIHILVPVQLVSSHMFVCAVMIV